MDKKELRKEWKQGVISCLTGELHLVRTEGVLKKKHTDSFRARIGAISPEKEVDEEDELTMEW